MSVSMNLLVHLYIVVLLCSQNYSNMPKRKLDQVTTHARLSNDCDVRKVLGVIGQLASLASKTTSLVLAPVLMAICEVVKFVDPDVLVEPAELAEPTKSTELAKTGELAELAKPAEPTNPAELAKPAEPTNPAEPTEPAEPAKTAQSTKPAESAEPAEPAKPAELAKPADLPELKRQATRLWLSEPDAEIFLPAWFELDINVLLKAPEIAAVYTRLPRQFSRDHDIIRAVLEADSSMIETVLDKLLDGQLTKDQMYRLSRNESWYKCVYDHVLRAAQTYPQAIKYAGIFAESNKMMAHIVVQNGQAIQYIPVEQRTSQLVVLAMTTFPGAVKYAPEDMRAQIERMGDKFGRLAELFASMHNASQAK